jgi:2-C-methyl-D-erythritol 4-phosphate cytidylyltransferase
VRLATILVAAGRGERLGGGDPKALVRVGGSTLLEHALRGLLAAGLEDVVVVHPAGDEERFAALAPGARLVPGGATRTASVRAGLTALAEDAEVVAVHDAARALMPPEVLRRVVAAVLEPTPDGEGSEPVVAAAPATPVTDTLKRVAGSQVVGTVDRDELVAVQTPQVFLREVLAAALEGGREATDDLALVERLVAEGVVRGRVVTVAGSTRGLKITWPDDVLFAEALLEHRP